MQAITYAMDVPKIRGATLAAAIGGMLATGSILLVFHLGRTAQPEAARWFWLYVMLSWSLFVFLFEGLAFFLSRRVPFVRHIVFVLVMTSAVSIVAGRMFTDLPALLVAEGVEPWLAVGLPAWFAECGLLALLVAVVWIVVAVWESKRATLTLGDDHLTCTVFGWSWRWAWHELPAFELRAPGGLVGRLLGRHLAVEGGRRALLTDVWNKPLDEILADLNEHRERALAARRDAGIEDSKEKAWAGADLPEVRYRRSRKSLARRGIFLGLLLLLPLSVLGYRCLLAYDSFAAYWAAEAGLILAAGGLILLLLAAIAAPLHPRFAGRMVLRFDGKGLTLGGLFRRRRWFWYDLSAFELDSGQLSRPALYFFFRGPGPHGAVESGRIGDSYDTPLAEIAAKLNDYRAQALAAGGAVEGG